MFLMVSFWCNYIQVKLSDYIGKKYVILFFYPLDFTFVCPTGALTILRPVKENYSFLSVISKLHTCKFCRDYGFQRQT